MDRRLAAVLLTDIVGYARLMGLDEAGTVARQKVHREEIINPIIELHHGRIVKSTGDGLLVEFQSVVDAVQCAVELQQKIASNESAVPEERRIEYRIGINLGDIIIDGDDILGDGVNVAARLEALAKPGGICISGTVHDHLAGKMDVAFEDGGEQTVKNVPRPIRVWNWKSDKTAALMTSRPRSRLFSVQRGWLRSVAIVLGLAFVATGGAAIWRQSQLSGSVSSTTNPSPHVSEQKQRSAIAVLPFINISGDKQQEYFADGITEDLITDLSKISSLSVISRTSTSGYKGKKVDVRKVGEALGVNYVIEGSVRRVSENVRINAQLTNAVTGSHIWAERYDGTLNDIFALQDKVLAKVVASLALKLSEEERRRVAAKGTESIAAHDLYLRGLFEESRFTREGNREARRLYNQALSIDPNYALPYTRVANILEMETRTGWSNNVQADLELAVEMAEKATRLEPESPKVYWSLGRAIARARKPDALKRGIAAMRRAIDLDPHFADAYAYLTVLYIGEGRADDGLRSIKTAMQINPSYPFWYLVMRGMARFFTKDYASAVADYESAVKRNPTALFVRWLLAAAYVQVGREDDAKWQYEEMKSMGFKGTISTIIETQPIRHPPYVRIYKASLRRAGIPE